MREIFASEYANKKEKVAKYKTLKKYFLITAFTSSCLAIGISFFIPKYQAGTEYKFPDQISLSDWRSQSSEDLVKSIKDPLFMGVMDARRYLYASSTQDTLRVDVLYMKLPVTLPKSLKLLNLEYSIDSLDIRHQKTIGYYALFNDEQRVYLSSCINARGLSTVTEEQLISNRKKYDFTPDRIVTYLLGMTAIRDNRCLLTIMSVPLETAQISNLNNNSLDNAYQKLEKTWINWHQKWENDFPKY
jgi:cyanosortase A-associated protein